MAAHLACANHGDRVAIFECRQCRRHLCEDCSKRDWTPKGFVDNCPDCGLALLELTEAIRAIERAEAAPERGVQGFLERLPEFLAFPVQVPVLLICLGLALITTPISWAVSNNISIILGLLGFVIVAAFELATYFRFVSQSAYGEKPETLEITDMMEDLFAPLFRYLVACSPMVVAVIWFGDELGSITLGALLYLVDPTVIFESGGPAALYVLGLVLLPLLTVIAAISRSSAAVLNPAIWLQSLRILGLTYVVAAVAFYLVLAFELLFWRSMLLQLRLDNPVPFITPVVATALGYLSMALRARILGGLCEPYFNDFDD